MITVLGARGFIGSNLIVELSKQKIAFEAPKKNDDLAKKNLGDIIYCIGLTADFRIKPFETVEAHVCKLKNILEDSFFDSLTYLSSTRLYIKNNNLKNFVTEDDDIVINPRDAFDLFAASKITGELLALNSGRDKIKIARLSNVFGLDLLSQNFITSIVKDALTKKKVELQTTPDSSKDYISIEDVCTTLINLAHYSNKGIYNLAYGRNTSNETILKELQKLTGAEISYAPNAQQIIFKEINNSKIKKEIHFNPSKEIIESLPEIVNSFKNKL